MTSPENNYFAQPSESRAVVDPEGGDGAYSYDGKPDRWKRYRLPDPETMQPGGWTRSTTYAKSISDTYTLSMWGGRMAIKGMAENDDLYAAVAATPLEDREKLNKLFEQCKERAGAKTGANLGTALHQFTEAVDRHEPIVIPPPWRPHVAAWQTIIEKYNMEIIEIERIVLWRAMENGIAGTLDRVVRFTKDTKVKVGTGKSAKTHTFKKGAVAILDLKTGRDLRYGWMEIAVQLAVYANAETYYEKPTDAEPSGHWFPAYPEMDKDVALVVHLPATKPGTEATADLYGVDIKFGRETAALCELVRNARKRKNVAVLLDTIEEVAGETIVVPSERVAEPLAIPGRALVVHEPTLLERIEQARTESDLLGIWWDALKTGQDTAELRTAIGIRKNQILADVAGG